MRESNGCVASVESTLGCVQDSDFRRCWLGQDMLSACRRVNGAGTRHRSHDGNVTLPDAFDHITSNTSDAMAQLYVLHWRCRLWGRWPFRLFEHACITLGRSKSALPAARLELCDLHIHRKTNTAGYRHTFSSVVGTVGRHDESEYVCVSRVGSPSSVFDLNFIPS